MAPVSLVDRPRHAFIVMSVAMNCTDHSRPSAAGVHGVSARCALVQRALFATVAPQSHGASVAQPGGATQRALDITKGRKPSAAGGGCARLAHS